MKRRLKLGLGVLLICLMLINGSSFAFAASIGENGGEVMTETEALQTEITETVPASEDEDKLWQTENCEIDEENSDSEESEMMVSQYEGNMIRTLDEPENTEETTPSDSEESGLADLEEVAVSAGWYCIYPAGSPNKCLDLKDYSDAEGAVIQICSAKKNLAQRFYIGETDEDGWYSIQNVASKKVLGVTAGESGESVLQWTDEETDGQKVKFYRNAEGYLIIGSKIGAGLVYSIDDESFATGALLQLAEYNDAITQKFLLSECAVPGEETLIEEGIYRLFPTAADGSAMDVKSGSTASGANVQLYESNGTGAQEWQITRVGSWYAITNVKSGCALDINGASEKAGSNVQQYTFNSSKAQLFRFYDAGDGHFYIMSKLGTVINCAGGVYENGINIQMDYWKGNRSQQWKLEPVIILSDSEMTIQDGYYKIKNADNSLLLAADGQNTVSGGNINVESENTSVLTQTYHIEKQSDGWYLIRNVRSSKYLTVTDGSKVSGTNLQQYNRTDEDAQKFKFYDAGNGQYYIKSKLQTVIEAVDGNAVMRTASAAVTQKWILSQVDLLPDSALINVAEGDYVLHSAINSQMVMDVKSGSKSSGANIQIYTDNGTNAQNFYISRTSDGWYTIQNNHSKLYLDVAGGSSYAGANLQQYTGNGTDAQKFRFYDAGDGKIVIQSKKGTVIDVYGGSSYAGANVQLYSYNGTGAQKWTLEASERLPMNQWVYQDGYKYYYGDNGKIVTDVSSIIGKQSAYLIKVNKSQNVVTVYAKDGSNGYIIPVKSMICSTGPSTPLGTFKVAYQWRWLQMVDDTWGQWITQFYGDYLFHSECYASKSADSLIVDEYNKLGTTCSHGCVRLKAGDSKWIYDNCSSSTTVVVYNSSDPGPFGKPSFSKLPSWHTWDPTDPNMYYKCQQRGCH